MRRFLLFIVAAIALVGCRTTRYIPVVETHTEYVTKHDTIMQRDSVMLHDSVYIHAKGDTVWYERWHTKYIDKYIYNVRVDTFLKRDSVPVPYPVPASLTWWQRTKIEFGGYLIGAVAVLIAVLYIMYRRKST